MSPLMIEMFLHIATRLEVYNDRGGNAQAEAMKWFRGNELIRRCERDEEGATVFGVMYRLTDRGHALVEKLCAVPLPQAVTTWV